MSPSQPFSAQVSVVLAAATLRADRLPRALSDEGPASAGRFVTLAVMALILVMLAWLLFLVGLVNPASRSRARISLQHEVGEWH